MNAVNNMVGMCITVQKLARKGKTSEIRGILSEYPSMASDILQYRPEMHPLVQACQLGFEDLVDYMVEIGSDLTYEQVKPFDLYYSPARCFCLLEACKRGQLSLVQLLIEDYGVDIETKGKNGYSALMHAMELDHIDVVKYLIHQGADINAFTVEGNMTPLKVMVTSTSIHSFTYFLQYISRSHMLRDFLDRYHKFIVHTLSSMKDSSTAQEMLQIYLGKGYIA